MPEEAARAAPNWEHFSHKADIGIRGFGRSLEEAFENAARALTAAIVPLETVAPKRSVAINCQAPDVGVLFVDWLNAIIFEMATKQMLFRDFSVQIADGTLTGEARGEPVDVTNHAPAVEPKGATFTALKVGRDADGHWTAECVVDV